MKKILAILLTVCMVIWTIPATVFAETPTTGEGGQVPKSLDTTNCSISLQNDADYFLESDITTGTEGKFTTTKTINVSYKEGDATATDLTKDTDYEITITKPSEFKARVTVTGKGNYTGSVFKDFDIVKNFDNTYFISPKASNANPAPADTIADQVYTGYKITPTPLYLYKTGGNNSVTKIDESNYTVSVEDKKGAGNVVVVTFTGKNQYRGTVTKNFNIVQRTADASMVTIPEVKVGSNVSDFAPTVKCGNDTFSKETDYTIAIKKGGISYTNTTFEAGAYTVTISFKENKNLTGTVEKTFIVDKAFKYNSVTVTKKTIEYDGTIQSIQNKDIVVKASNDDGANAIDPSSTTYTVSYQKNGTPVSPKDVGTYDLVLTDSDGGKHVEKNALTITQRTLTKTSTNGHYVYTSGLEKSYSYSGKMVDPAFNVCWYHNGVSTLLKKGAGYDYTTTYSYDYIKGTGSVTIDFTGNFKGSITETFTIYRGNVLSDFTVYVPTIADQTYTGSYIKPYISVYYGGATATTARTLLTENVHYTLTYTSNIYPGTATVTITGKGQYAGTVTKSFKIKYNLSNATVTTTPTSYAYDGIAKRPAVTVKVGTRTVPASDYDVTYLNNTNVGTATVTVTAKKYGDAMGSKTAYFTITGKDGIITPEYATFSKKTTKSKPFAIRMITNTTDGTGYSYTSSDTSVATVAANGTVTVKGCGKAVITVTTTGNKAYNPATATVTITVKPTKGIITSLTSTARGKLVVKYKKESPNADYYQIRYGRAGDYTVKTVKNSTALTGKSTIKGLQSGKKYYVKVRGVKELADGTILYGAWSNSKNTLVK